MRDIQEIKSAELGRLGVEVRKGGERNDSQVLGLGNRVDDWAIL